MSTEFASPKRRRVQACPDVAAVVPRTPVEACKVLGSLDPEREQATPEGKAERPGGSRSSWALASDWSPKMAAAAAPPAACVPVTTLLPEQPAPPGASLAQALRAAQNLMAGHVAEFLWSLEERTLVIYGHVIRQRRASRDLWELLGASREIALEMTVGIKNRRGARPANMRITDQLQRRLPRKLWAESRRLRVKTTSRADREDAISVLRNFGIGI